MVFDGLPDFEMQMTDDHYEIKMRMVDDPHLPPENIDGVH